MKNHLLASVFFLLAIEAQGQGYTHVVNSLNKIYKDHGAGNVSEPIAFDSIRSLLVIDNYNVPMSDNTFIQCVKNRSANGGLRYSAKFYMQQGEVITLQGNELIQKSFLSIPLTDKETCRQFVFNLEQLKKEL